jgi:catechol 2,3-dioxygenase-like lactoylglutathione lyase family enzyme
MATHETPFGVNRSLLRLDGHDPYLCLHFVIIYVRDLDRSVQFYVDKLGFRLVIDHQFDNGQRWIEVAPADGNAHLGFALLQPTDDAEKLIRPESRIWFITEDVHRKYEEWKARGVQFRYPPEVPLWGGIHTRFEDPDGNSFGLAGFDELSRSVEAQRRVLAEKFEALYTDGVTEACSDAGEEFGENALLERLCRYRDAPCQNALASITSEVCAYNPHEQQDDVTMIIAKCKTA